MINQKDKKIIGKILSILDRENRPLNIKELKLELEKEGIKKSYHIITKYLEMMEKEGILEEK